MARGRKTAAASSRDLMAQRKNGAAGPQAAAPCPPPATSSPPAAEPRAYKQPADLLEYPVSPPNAGSGVQHRLPNMAPAQHHDQSMIPLAHLEPYPQHPHPPNPQAPTMSHLSSMVLPDPSGLPPGTHVQHPFSQHPQHPHHPHHPPSPPHMHTVAAGADHHHHQGHPPPAPESAAGNYTYANLTDGIVSHVFFPLVLKKIFEHLVQEELPANHSAAHFRILEERARELKSYGETYGLEVACEKYASVDLFMSAMVTSLSGLQQRVTSGSIDALLADTLAVASAAIQNLGAIPDGMRAGAVGDPSLAPAPSRFGGVAAGSGVTKPSPGSRGMEDDLGAPRRKLKPHARRCLEEWFQNHLEAPYPTDAEKQALATQCQLEIQQVNNYFGNKRMRMKRKMLAVSGADAAGASGQSAAQASPKTPGKQKESALAPQSKWKNVVLSKLSSPVARQALGFEPMQPGTQISGAAARALSSAASAGAARREDAAAEQPPTPFPTNPAAARRPPVAVDPFYCDEDADM